MTAWLTTVTEHSLGRFRAASTQTASLATCHASSFDECSYSNAQMCKEQTKVLTLTRASTGLLVSSLHWLGGTSKRAHAGVDGLNQGAIPGRA
jgi:hypothetical protein